MLKYLFSWIQRRPKDLPGCLSPLILGRLNYYGNCICVFSYFLHAGVTFGGILFRPTIISPIWSLLLFISLPKEKLNLIVMIKVTADRQVKKSMLPTHSASPFPGSPILSMMQVSWERKKVESKQERWKGYLWSFPSLSLTEEGIWPHTCWV